MTSLSLSNMPATIVPDGTQGRITKTAPLGLAVLVNGGTVDVWCRVNAAAGQTVATNDAQTDPTNANPFWGACIPVGASFPIMAHYKTIDLKTAGSAGILYWIPEHRGADC